MRSLSEFLHEAFPSPEVPKTKIFREKVDFCVSTLNLLFLLSFVSVINFICMVLNWFSRTGPEFITLRLWERRVLLVMARLSPLLKN